MKKSSSRIRRMLWSILWIVVGVYVGLLVILYLLQARIVYQPHRRIEATPDAVGLSYEAVSFHASDGVKLAGWFVPAQKPRAVVLFCHGNGGNISHRLDSMLLFHRLGLSTFIFDYRGYGQSEGKPTESGTYLDAEAAWDYLVGERGRPPEEIILFGRSLGGAVAAHLAGDRKPGLLIVESACTSVPDIGSEMYPYLPVRLLSRFSYDAAAYLHNVTCPVLVAHSRADEMIPFHHGRRLFEAANEPKEFLEMKGGHNDGFQTTGRHYTEALDAFITRHAAR